MLLNVNIYNIIGKIITVFLSLLYKSINITIIIIISIILTLIILITWLMIIPVILIIIVN